MPTTSKLAFPSPSLSDGPSVPTHIQALAQKVEDVLSASFAQAASASVAVASSAQSASLSVTFPRAYASTPAVTATVSGTGNWMAFTSGKTAAGFTLNIVWRTGTNSGGATNVSVDWQAVGAI